MADSAEVLERVGRYEILLPIAKGGMATVYLARSEGHGGFDRYVALKLTLPHLRGDPEFAAHLLDEAKLVAHLRHTHVVPVLDVGQDERGVFLVMDYVPGDSLSGLYKLAAEQETTLPPRVALRVLVDALDGLHAAHEHGDEDGYPLHLVHRDFSPQNILVGTDGVGRLTDFGIAKAASRVSSTQAGHIKGKMSYVAPEQTRGIALDRRCDLWAAGVIAWEIMCGQKMLAPNDARAAVSASKAEPPRIRTVVPDAPKEIDDLIASVLKLDREVRPATAAIFARDLAAAARGAGMLAETHEVAEQVKRLAGPMLAERRARLATARRRRDGSIPDGISTVIGLPSPLEAASANAMAMVAAAPPPEPAKEAAKEPDKEPDKEEELDDLSISVIEGSEPPPAMPKAPPPDLPRRMALPVVVPVAVSVVVPPAAKEPKVTPLLSTATPSGVSSDAAPLEDEPIIPGVAPRGPRLALVLGALGVVVAIVVVGITLSLAGARDSSALAGADSASASAGAGANRGPSTVVTAPPPPPPPASASAEPIVPPVQFLALTANAPVIEVRVGERVVDMVIAAPNVNVELEPEETNRPLKITAKTTDGRVTTVDLRPGEVQAKISFGERAAAPRIAQPPPGPAPRGPSRPGAPRRL